MKPGARDDRQLLAWAASLLQREQDRESYGTVTFNFEKGRIVRARFEHSEKPPDQPGKR